jgi:hypothetical protein
VTTCNPSWDSFSFPSKAGGWWLVGGARVPLQEAGLVGVQKIQKAFAATKRTRFVESHF